MTEDTLLGKGIRFRALPEGAERHIVVGENSYPLLSAAGEPRYAQIRPNVGVEVYGNPLLKQALGSLAEPLRKAGVRLLVLEPGGNRTMPQDPPADPGKAAQGERIDPASLATALAGLPAGQTLVVCAGGEGDLIRVRPTAEPERSLPIGEIVAAAEGADVTLIVLQFTSTLQASAAGVVACPDGGRPAPELTLADILDAAVAQSRQAPVAVALAGRRRALDATAIGDLASGTEIRLGDARQRQLGPSFLANLPVPFPALYLGMLMLGWLGTPVARNWWAKVWNAGDAAEYPGRAGYWAACVASFLAFALVFQPVTGVVTALVNLVPQIWAAIRPAVWGLFVVLRWIVGLGGGGKLKTKQTGRQSA
jgi:hypothetical protein